MAKRKALKFVAIGLVLAGLGACGQDSSESGSTSEKSRTIEVKMVDIDFDPSFVQVKRGEKVTFVFENAGALVHEAVIGTPAEQAEHESAMVAKSGDMADMHHDDADEIEVAPGKKGTLSHVFTKKGIFEIGCHVPGHYSAGMKVRIEVS